MTDVLDALAASPDFSVLARDVATGEFTHRPPKGVCFSPTCKCCTGAELWLGRVRSGLSPSERRAASWTTTTCTPAFSTITSPILTPLTPSALLNSPVFPIDTVLDSFQTNSSPERRFGFAYTDAVDVLIVDERPYSAPGDDWNAFAQGVTRAVCRARGAEDFEDLLRKEKAGAREGGELPEGEVLVFGEGMKARTMFREE